MAEWHAEDHYYKERGNRWSGGQPLDASCGSCTSRAIERRSQMRGKVLASLLLILLLGCDFKSNALRGEPRVSGLTRPVSCQRIAFTSNAAGNDDIYVLDVDTGKVSRLTFGGNNLHPSWSPDGKRIAFMSDRDGNYEIYVMDNDGQNLLRLTNNPSDDWYPNWSPDGLHIAFMSKGKRNIFQIYTMDANGLNMTQLTDTTWGHNGSPVWSPDSKRILFNSGRNTIFGVDLYVMKADGSNQICLVNNHQQNTSYSWSPDGLQIVFSTFKYAGGIPTYRKGELEGHSQLYVIDADGKNLARLASTSSNDGSPIWTSDGQYIVFVSDRNGKDEIFKMHVDGTYPLRIGTMTDGWSRMPSCWP